MDEEQEQEMSDEAVALARLKTSVLQAAKDRDRLPQPLFWSLFHSELKKIKEKRCIKRALDELLSG